MVGWRRLHEKFFISWVEVRHLWGYCSIMPLCAICDNVDLCNLTDWDNDLQDIPHHKSLSSLKESARTCSLCNLFFSGLSADQPALCKEEHILSNSPILLRGRQILDDESNQGGIYALKARCDRARARAVYGLYADENSVPVVPQDKIVGRAIRPAEDRFDLIKMWINNCTNHHTLCHVPTGRLPARVIDVGVADIREPSLRITNRDSGQYIALSHCWGSNPVIRTTKETLPQHQRQLPMKKLPKTFQDAVIIAQMLSIRYLWIDSLCIIQDDVQDWEEQSAIMGDIYSQAYLTIAATASKDSSGGCFLPRSTKNHVRVKCSINESQPGYVFVREKPNGFDELDKSILNTRAWVAQERLLSPRTIHYDIDQLLWECRECRLSEDEVPVGASTTQRLIWDERLHLQYPYKRKGASDGKFIWDWYHLVENYTTRNLTNLDDKLPAVSGLASVMERRIGDVYVAGLWQSHVIIGLLWHRQKDWLIRTIKYRAPSWSWAAFDGHVAMPSEADIDSVIPAVRIAELVRVDVKPEGRDPHGKLASGRLTISAPLRAADPRVDPLSKSNGTYEGQPIKEHLYDNGQSIGWAVFDQNYEPSGPLYCAQFTIKRLPVQDLCYSLLLEPTGRENEYRRIGLGCPTRSSWYDPESKSLFHVI